MTGDLDVRFGERSVRVKRRPGERELLVDWPGFRGREGLEARLLLRNDDAEDSLVVATVESGRGFSVSERRALFSVFGYVVGIRTWDLTPDDRTLIMIRERASVSGASALTVIENLPGELRSAGSR